VRASRQSFDAGARIALSREPRIVDVEISPCSNGRGNTGVDKRVFLSDQYATVRCTNGPSGQLLITQQPDLHEQTNFFGSTEDPF